MVAVDPTIRPIAFPSITASELSDRLTGPQPAEGLSAAEGVPAVVVDLAGAAVLDPDRLDGLSSLPCITVGLVEPDASPGKVSAAARLDLAIGRDDPALADVEATVAAAPTAAVSFALLLRGGERRTIAEGLVAESATYSMLQAGPDFAAWRAGRSGSGRPTGGEGEVVRVDREGPVLRVTLSRPERHNAFSVAIREGLIEALSVAVADPGITRVVLDGSGPSFCSGGDLDEFGTFPDPAQAHLIRLTRSPTRLMAELADRLEVHLHGACLGAGIELPAFARRIVARPDARIGLPEVGLGLVPGAGGTVSLPRRIGRQRTALLGLSGRPVDAATALAWGLVDEMAG